MQTAPTPPTRPPTRPPTTEIPTELPSGHPTADPTPDLEQPDASNDESSSGLFDSLLVIVIVAILVALNVIWRKFRMRRAEFEAEVVAAPAVPAAEMEAEFGAAAPAQPMGPHTVPTVPAAGASPWDASPPAYHTLAFATSEQSSLQRESMVRKSIV